MTHVTHTSHPRVTVEHRPGGPVVVHDRRGSDKAIRRSRLRAIIVGFACFAVLIFLLLQMLRAEDLSGAGFRLVALGGGLLIASAVGYLVIVGRGREEIELIGDRLQIRAWPFDSDYGRSIQCKRIDYLFVEKEYDYNPVTYRIQVAGREGNALLPRFRALSDIPTQEEATALARTIASQYGLRFEACSHSTSELEPIDYELGVVTGKIRVKHLSGKLVVSYASGLPGRLPFIAFFAIWFLTVWSFTKGILSMEVRGVEFVGSLAFVSIFWFVGIFGLLSIFDHDEFYREKDQFVIRSQLGPINVHSKQISWAELEQISVDIYWDDYKNMHHRVVAHVRMGDDVTIMDSTSEPDGHALCQALHKHLGVPI
jgi:hypothetical protein